MRSVASARTSVVLSLAGLLFAANLAAAQGTIRGVVTDSLLQRAPLQGATVVLQGAPHTAVTDRLGRFVLRDVPAGSYTIGFFHPSLDSLEASAPVKRVEVKDRETANVHLGMPSANTLSQAFCGKEMEPASSVVFGIVRDAEGDAPLPGAIVRANWFVWQLVGGVGSEAQRVEPDTAGADGRFVLCGVPNDIALSLTATLDGQMTGDLSLSLDHLDLGRRDLMVSRTDTAARIPPPMGDDTLPWMRPAGSARAAVTVLGENGRPVSGATVGVRGTRVNGKTAADGTVRLVGIPAGTQTLLVRRAGSEPAIQLVAMRSGRENPVEVRMGRTITELPSMAVTGVRETTLDRDIRSRVLAYNGRALEGKDLEKLTTGSLAGWLLVPGLRVVEDGMDALPVMQDSRMQPCQPNLWYNGTLSQSWNAWELRTMLIGAKRMEVYTRPGNVPPQFLTHNDCGAIAIWG